MKIVILDGHTLNPGDLSWEGLSKFGELKAYERTPPELVAERCAEAEIIITNKAIVTRETINSLPALRYIGVTATGVNIVDCKAATERSIPVTNVPGYGPRSVAQMTFAHILNFTQQTAHHANEVSKGRWSNCPDFCFTDFPLVELDGLVLGILGYGDIGKESARIGRAFGMEVIAHSRSLTESIPGEVEAVDLSELFVRSDVLSLHCPLTPETEKVVNAESLASMKPSAFLINTGRGPLVDEQALANTLNGGKLAGAGLDVLSTEPPPPDNPLIGAKNCIVTPHIAWATLAARKRLLDITVANLKAFLEGVPKNIVNEV
ncbi:MAG: D-2-hydroxyacid dehydrogenase [Opitutae bacterium]|nr:D-2-hydroxyacid dehydrogenase [Opitutae bacterium]MBT5908197.1 D-2-hydroxyacid dehydrogenase [Opitutae bacterium]MBT7743107.1 D-2-hydroxyacid dehydrogenase [Opitutae bacterium]